ncbi:MAG: 50S ribosomal protein L32 [Candidatus Pacebacteria bacterium]|nr:50S ribosomal protein L32 [Candidatus Paceibacterota bacterium]
MTVRMRHTSGHTKNRRSHHSLTAPRLSRCSDCGSFHLRHRACEVCGKYKSRPVIDVATRIEKKNERKKAKLKMLGKDPSEKPKKEKITALNPEKLSKKAK